MQDDKAKTESELTTFFEGLDAGVKILREVRTAYDEQIAFDFNMLRFFNPKEKKISEILAFFLDPKNNHGQKDAFLRAFLEHFQLSDNISSLLSADEVITVTPEHRTEYNRRIDITVFFTNAEFAIGIENKSNDAPDLKNQVLDYCKDLDEKTHGKYVLLYLTPNGHEPPKISTGQDEFKKFSVEYPTKRVSYSEIVDLLNKYETVCRADNVRGFIRQFQHYIKQDILRKPSFMSEPNFYINYLKENPKMLKHIDALWDAGWSLKKECCDAFWGKVAEHLMPDNITFDVEGMWCAGSFVSSEIKHPGLQFGDQLKQPAVFYEPGRDRPVYITIGLSGPRDNLDKNLIDKVERLQEKLKAALKEDVDWPKDWTWCAVVYLPYPKFNDWDEICECAKGGSKMQDDAAKAANIISKYIKVAEDVLCEMPKQ